MPVRPGSRLRVGAAIDDTHCHVPVVLVFKPKVRAALVYRNIPRAAL